MRRNRAPFRESLHDLDQTDLFIRALHNAMSRDNVQVQIMGSEPAIPPHRRHRIRSQPNFRKTC